MDKFIEVVEKLGVKIHNIKIRPLPPVFSTHGIYEVQVDWQLPLHEIIRNGYTSLSVDDALTCLYRDIEQQVRIRQ